MAGFSCTPADRPVGFVFAEQIGDDATAICRVAGYIAGLTFGLEPVTDCRDFMAPVCQLEGASYLDEDLPCGYQDPTECMCGGGTTQNSQQALLERLGPSCD